MKITMVNSGLKSGELNSKRLHSLTYQITQVENTKPHNLYISNPFANENHSNIFVDLTIGVIDLISNRGFAIARYLIYCCE